MSISGIGLGFRREIHSELLDNKTNNIDFIEFAPENWMKFGGFWNKILHQTIEKYPIVCHGLSLSIGSPDDLDFEFLKDLKKFFKIVNPRIYSEHLSYSKCDNAHIYELLPIPFREDAVKHIVERIKIVQDYLEMPIALENVSYYTSVGAEITESLFIKEIVNESNCNLLLDVNNVYVNSFNHKYDPKEFILNLPLDKVSYIHIAGHKQYDEDTIIDTHGEDIIDPVYELLKWTSSLISAKPILLERDYNIPKIETLFSEINKIKETTEQNWILKNA